MSSQAEEAEKERQAAELEPGRPDLGAGRASKHACADTGPRYINYTVQNGPKQLFF